MLLIRNRITAILLAFVLLAAAIIPLPAKAQPLTDEEGWYHCLLIGTDTRQDKENAGRSDTMMVASVHPDSGRIKLASLARDMWVTIPGHGENKLNAAHSWGGPELLLETINRTFGMELTDYVSVNFFGLVDLVDALGGVEVEITRAEAGVINNGVAKEHPHAKVSRVKEGKAHLCGVQALSYARIRKLDSDFGRTSRQRKLVSAMLEKIQRMDAFGLISAASALRDDLTVHFENEGAMLMLLYNIVQQKGLEGIEELSLPSEGNYRYHSNDGVSKVLFDAQQVSEEWRAFVYGP